jgi:hypothetical protein
MRKIPGFGAAPRSHVSPLTTISTEITMSRPPLGPALVDRLSGSDAARQRTRLMLETISGATSVEAAAEQLGISTQRFHDLRDELIQGAIAAAEPKPIGRPAKQPSIDDQIRAALAEKDRIINELRVRVELAKLREELAAAGMTNRFGPREKKRR